MANAQDHDPLCVEPIADDVAALAELNAQLPVIEGKVSDGATDLGVGCQYQWCAELLPGSLEPEYAIAARNLRRR